MTCEQVTRRLPESAILPASFRCRKQHLPDSFRRLVLHTVLRRKRRGAGFARFLG
jgi:hypothetical protein